MSYYDPWQHAIQLFANRLLEFVFLLVLLGLMLWAGLLHWYFEASWIETARATWAIRHNSEPRWHAIFGLCLLAGALMSGWLFTWLILAGRLRGGERHHRGARVIHRDPQD